MGLLLMVPALALSIVQFVLPSLATAVGSTQDLKLLANEVRSVGLANYAEVAPLLPGPLALAVGTALALTVLGVLGLVFGTVAGRGGTLARRATAALAGVMIALYAPIGMATALRMQEREFGSSAAGAILGSGLVWAPALLGGGTLVALLIVRPGRPLPWSALAIAGLGGAFAALAGGLQSFGVLTSIGSMVASDTTALQPVAYRYLVQNATLGPTYAIQTIVLAVVGVLGVVAVCVIVAGRIRLELMGTDRPGSTAIGWIGLGLVTVALVACLVVHRDWLAGLVAPADEFGDLPIRWLLNTWPPALAVTVIQVVVGAAAGLGIGLLRPFGQHSLWLLLVFAPWLFTGASPLAPQRFLEARQLDLLDTVATLLPPVWVSAAATVAFTLLFAALGEAHRRAESDSSTGMTTPRAVLAAIAGIVVIGVVLLLANAQSFPWNYLTALRPESFTGPTAVRNIAGELAHPGVASAVPQWISTPIPIMVLAAVLVAAAAVVLTDRIALVAGSTPASSSGD